MKRTLYGFLYAPTPILSTLSKTSLQTVLFPSLFSQKEAHQTPSSTFPTYPTLLYKLPFPKHV